MASPIPPLAASAASLGFSPSPPRQQQQQQQQQHPPLPPALQHLAAHDLATGTGAYASLQPTLRQTFAALLDAAAASHAQTLALEARLARQEARRREEGEASAVALRTVRTLLDGHVEALRAEFGPRLRAVEARATELATEQGRLRTAAREETGARMVEAALIRRVELLQGEVVRLARALDGKADGSEVEAALRLRVSKASLPKRVEAILLHGGEADKGGGVNGHHHHHHHHNKGGSGKPSSSSAAAGGSGSPPLLAGLRRRIEAVEGRQTEQDRTVRRLSKEVDAVRTHVVGGPSSSLLAGGGGADDGESNGGGGQTQQQQQQQPSSSQSQAQEGLTGVLRGLQAVLEQQGKRVLRAEKEVGALKEKVVRELALVEGRVEERVRGRAPGVAQGQDGGTGPAGAVVVEESLRAFEQEIVRELDARDGALRRELEGTLGLVREVEARVQRDGERLARVEETSVFHDAQRVAMAQRLDRLERAQETGASAGAGTGAGGEPSLLPRPSLASLRGGGGGTASSGYRTAPVPAFSTATLAATGGAGVGAGASVGGMQPPEEPETPDVVTRHHAFPPPVGPPPALSQSSSQFQQQQQAAPPQSSQELPPPPAPAPGTTTLRFASSLGGGGSGRLGAGTLSIPGPPPPPPSAPQPFLSGALQQSAAAVGTATVRSSSHGGGSAGPASPAFFFQQPEYSSTTPRPTMTTTAATTAAGGAVPGGDGGSSTLRSFGGEGGGGMPTIWRGTGAVGLGDETAATNATTTTAAATMMARGSALASSSSSAAAQREQLQTLRREKELLRARIREGLMSLSLGTTGAAAAAATTTGGQQLEEQQQQQHHMSRSAGAASGGGGGHAIGALERTRGSVSSMV